MMDDTQDNVNDNEIKMDMSGMEGDTEEEEEVSTDASPLHTLPDEAAQTLQASIQDPRETLYFRDGKRRIDYILAYEDLTDEKKQDKRNYFKNQLQEEGLEFDEEEKDSQDGKTYYCKIHAPWEVLTRMAELMSAKMPIKEYDAQFKQKSTIDCCLNAFKLPEDLVKSEPVYFTANFNIAHQDLFLIEDKDTFFSPAQRSMFVHEMLLRTSYKEGKGKIGINFLLDEGVYSAAYPLHEGQYEVDWSVHSDSADSDRHSNCIFAGIKAEIQLGLLICFYFFNLISRVKPVLSTETVLNCYWILDFIIIKPQPSEWLYPSLDLMILLYKAWARPSMWYFMQPLDLIRRYFGEKIGMYFSWLGFYTMMLIPASIVGLICFIYGCATIMTDVPSHEICDDNVNAAGNFAMCPQCDQWCPYWRLSTSCLHSKLTYLFDNYATALFAGFMAIWSMIFLEFWKRKQAEIQYDWDVAGYELEEHVRPGYEIKCTQQRLNPVTQTMEPFLPTSSKLPRKCASYCIVLFMISCVIIAVFGVIMYRIIIITLLYAMGNEIIQQNAKITTSCTAACINLLVIMILNKVYTWLAVLLTDLERPRTDSDYEDSYTFKMFLFQFINCYSSIFYVAFIKGRFDAHPGAKYHIVAYPQEECDPAGCLVELCIQVGIIMVGKQVFSSCQELLLLKLMVWLEMRKREETENNIHTCWEHDNNLATAPDMPVFNEYLEMIIQYGFVTIFVAAFPLAPLFALLNNIFEIRIDAYKFVAIFRRPIAQRAQDIGKSFLPIVLGGFLLFLSGIWFPILKGISYTAVLTNACIIGWTSDFIPKLVYMFAVSPDSSMAGYVNHSLSYFDIHDFSNQSTPHDRVTQEFPNLTYCRYSDYRHPPWSPDKYEYTSFYWHVLTGRLAFIISFDHVIFILIWLINYLIPDVPLSVRQLMRREVYLAKEGRYTAALSNKHTDQEQLSTEDEEEPPV